MYAQTDDIIPARSLFQNYFVRGGWPFQRRHSEAWAAVRGIAAAWLITAGTVLWTHGYPWGALLYLAATADLALGYRLLKTKQSARR